jgi:hypothetical protein
MRKEGELYDQLVKGANAEGWHLFRCYDSELGKAPADILGVAPNGLGVCMEVKAVDTFRRKDGTATPSWGAYLPHQVSWCHRYAEANALALLVEHCAESRETRVWMPWFPADFEKSCMSTNYCCLTLVGNMYLGFSTILRERSKWPPWIGLGLRTSHRRGPVANRG